MPRRRFDIAATPGGEPVEFEVAGVEFRCLPTLPARASVSLATMPSATLASIGFISDCLETDADVQAFNDLLNARDVTVTGAALGDIVEWLTEVYTARPTGPPSDSAGAPRSDGGASVDNSSPPASGSRI